MTEEATCKFGQEEGGESETKFKEDAHGKSGQHLGRKYWGNCDAHVGEEDVHAHVMEDVYSGGEDASSGEQDA